MKKLFFFFLFGVAFNASAQSLIGGDNIIKTNLSSNLLQNYNITYERNLNHFMSASISYRNMAKTKLPLKAIAKKFIQNDNIDFDNFEIGNNALTAELRFYLGLSKMSGFYIAPYARSAAFDLTIPINYSYTPSQTIPSVIPKEIQLKSNLDGTIRSTSYGAYIGIQFQVLTKIVVDFWLVGGHYGSSNGKLIYNAPEGTPNLAIEALKRAVDQTNVNPFQFKTTTTTNGIITDTQGPWAGIRGLGLTLGVRF